MNLNGYWWRLVDQVIAGEITWDEADRKMGEIIALDFQSEQWALNVDALQ